MKKLYSKPQIEALIHTADVIASSGDTPTLEALAAVKLLKKYLPDLSIRYINVVDLMRLVSSDRHPHGLSHSEYDKLFTKNKPIIFTIKVEMARTATPEKNCLL